MEKTGNQRPCEELFFEAALGIGKMLGLNESFGNNISGRYGTISIPGSSNSVVKSPVSISENTKKTAVVSTKPTPEPEEKIDEGALFKKKTTSIKNWQQEFSEKEICLR